jgi:hypothetical protein
MSPCFNNICDCEQAEGPKRLPLMFDFIRERFNVIDKPTKNSKQQTRYLRDNISKTIRGKDTQAGLYLLIKRILRNETFRHIYFRPSYYFYSDTSVIIGILDVLSVVFVLFSFNCVDGSCIV